MGKAIHVWRQRVRWEISVPSSQFNVNLKLLFKKIFKNKARNIIPNLYDKV